VSLVAYIEHCEIVGDVAFSNAIKSLSLANKPKAAIVKLNGASTVLCLFPWIRRNPLKKVPCETRQTGSAQGIS
jgi:hypothetical protein